MSPVAILVITLLYNLFFQQKAVYGQCPVCIVTVGGGMLIAKKLGIDDLLVSVWISALNVAISFWLAPKVKIKYLRNPHLFAFLTLAATLIYFRFTDQIGNSSNRVLGIDKIILGQILGLLIMAIANHSYLYIKKRLGRTPFLYAKVVFPLVSVLFLTLALKLVFNL